MKNLLLFFLLIGLNGYGQSALNIMKADTNAHLMTKQYTQKSNYDTILCIVLCIDTSRRFFEHYEMTWSSGRCDSAKLVREYHNYAYPFAFWIEGYEVQLIRDIIYEDGQRPVSHIAWLDEKKQPISKKRIVWMSKEIK